VNEWEAYAVAAKEAGCPADQIERFCRHGIILSPKQLQASAAARLCDSPDGPTEIGVGGAKGGAKSHWMIVQMAVDDAQRVPGYKGLFLRKVGKAALESLIDLSRNALCRVPHRLTARGMIDLPNGSRIIAGHFNAEKDIDAYLGLEYDCIGIEEYTLLSSSKLKSIATCCRTSKVGWRPRIYNSTNPGGISHALYKNKFIAPFRAGKETDTRFIPFLVDDNPFINPDYKKTLDNLTGWQKRAWRYGDWDIAAGQFFTTFAERHHKVDEIDERLARSWFCGFDYGMVHFTVCVLGFWDGDGNAWIVDSHAQRGWLVPRHAEAIRAMLGRHNRFEAGQLGKVQAVPLTVADLDYFVAGGDVFSKQSNGRTIADEYRENGIKLTAGNTDRINGAANILRLLGDPEHGQPVKLRIHSRCARLLNEIPAMQHDPDRPEDILKTDVTEDGEGGDDSCDALRYALMRKFQPVTMQKLSGR